MAKFGPTSKKNLSEAHSALQRLFEEVVKHHDCSVIEGHRPQAEQEKAFHSGKSKVNWPDSKHNSTPSNAVDVVPYPIDWNDKERFYYFAGIVKGIASQMGIPIRWGGDWNSNNIFNDQSFHDLPHFELAGTLQNDKVEYLPDGPSDEDINTSLEDIENEALKDMI